MPEKKRTELFEAFEVEDYSDVSNYPYFLPSDEVFKYTLHVTLKDYKPAIYRKFNVPSLAREQFSSTNATTSRLHR